MSQTNNLSDHNAARGLQPPRTARSHPRPNEIEVGDYEVTELPTDPDLNYHADAANGPRIGRDLRGERADFVWPPEPTDSNGERRGQRHMKPRIDRGIYSQPPIEQPPQVAPYRDAAPHDYGNGYASGYSDELDTGAYDDGYSSDHANGHNGHHPRRNGEFDGGYAGIEDTAEWEDEQDAQQPYPASAPPVIDLAPPAANAPGERDSVYTGPPPLDPPDAPLDRQPGETEMLTFQERHQLLMHTIRLYSDWKLAGIRAQPDTNMLIALLIPRDLQMELKEAVKRNKVLIIRLAPNGNTSIQEPKKRRLLSGLTSWITRLG